MMACSISCTMRPLAAVNNSRKTGHPVAARSSPSLSSALRAPRVGRHVHEYVDVATERRAVSCHSLSEEVQSKGASMIIDADDACLALDQPISGDEMIAKAKDFLVTSVLDTANLGDYMADDFRFVAPVVGPLSKKEFLAAFSGFNILEAFPDLNPRYHHFRLDPFEAGRVWFTTTAVGTHTGTLAGTIEATGIEVRSPPQTCSVIINKDGLISKYTVGYVNDKELGNTGGLGGVFGIFYAVGSPLPFPEANPWKKSKRYAFFQWLGKVSSSLRGTKSDE